MAKFTRKNRNILRKKYSKKQFLKFKNIQKYKNSHKYIEPKVSTIYKDFQLIDNFSLINNFEEFNCCINDLHNFFRYNNNVFIHSNRINKLTPDALTVLISKLNKQSYRYNASIKGDFPIDEECRNVWDDSGFNNYVKTNFSHTSAKGLIVDARNKLVVPDKINKLVKFATKQLLGEEKPAPSIQSVFLELMGNANEHSSKTGKMGVEEWWASVYWDEIERTAKFCFVDNGLGIFNTIKGKNWKSKKAILIKNNIDILVALLKGEIEISKTKKRNRGFGLHNIYKKYSRREFKRLIIITNDTYADFENNIFKNLNNKFHGTFIYWELDYECYNNQCFERL